MLHLIHHTVTLAAQLLVGVTATAGLLGLCAIAVRSSWLDYHPRGEEAEREVAA